MEFISLLKGLTGVLEMDCIWKAPKNITQSDLPFRDMIHQSPFCQKIKSNNTQLKQCIFDCSDRIHYFKETNDTCMKNCHAGGELIYAPFSIKEIYVGTLLIGPFTSHKKNSDLPYLTKEKQKHLIEIIEMIRPIIIREVVEKVPFFDREEQNPLFKCFAYCKQHLHEEITIDILAKHCHLSTSRLMHLCKEKMGRSIIDILIEMRIQKACELLESTNFKIKDISTLSGFANLNYFHLRFRSWIKLTPKEYRAKNHKVNEP